MEDPSIPWLLQPCWLSTRNRNGFGLPNRPTRKSGAGTPRRRPKQPNLSMPKISHLAVIVECVAIFGSGVASGQGRIQLDGGEKRYINETLGFSIVVPSGWSVTPDRNAPIFTNFRPSEAHAQLELPRGGAIIIVDQEPPGALSKPLSQWAKEDVRGLSSGTPSVGSFVPPAAAEITD